MPPKKKKGKKGKKKGGDGASPGPEETGEPSEKEIMLQAEWVDLDQFQSIQADGNWTGTCQLVTVPDLGVGANFQFNFSMFMQFLPKFVPNNRLAPPWHPQEILDPPLLQHVILKET